MVEDIKPQFTQSAVKYPVAQRRTEGALIECAQSRAEFWGYDTQSSWTVTIRTPTTDGGGLENVEITRTSDGRFTFGKKTTT